VPRAVADRGTHARRRPASAPADDLAAAEQVARVRSDAVSAGPAVDRVARVVAHVDDVVSRIGVDVVAPLSTGDRVVARSSLDVAFAVAGRPQDVVAAAAEGVRDGVRRDVDVAVARLSGVEVEARLLASGTPLPRLVGGRADDIERCVGAACDDLDLGASVALRGGAPGSSGPLPSRSSSESRSPSFARIVSVLRTVGVPPEQNTCDPSSLARMICPPARRSSPAVFFSVTVPRRA
jgi:hypothetical protein